MKRERHIFISYVSEDSETVFTIADALRSFGINVWLDKKDLSAGKRWKTEIKNAIRQGVFFLACFSDNYIKKDSSFMNEELILAIEELRLKPFNTSWFIPIRLTNCEIPEMPIGVGATLRDLQWIDMYPSIKDGIDNLASILVPVIAPLHLMNTQLPRFIQNKIKHYKDTGALIIEAVQKRWIGLINNESIRINLLSSHVELWERAKQSGTAQSDRIIEQCKNGRIIILTVAPYEDSYRLCNDLSGGSKTTAENYSDFIHKQKELFWKFPDWKKRDFVHIVHLIGEKEALLDMFYSVCPSLQFAIIGKLIEKHKNTEEPVLISYADIYPTTIINSVEAG